MTSWKSRRGWLGLVATGAAAAAVAALLATAGCAGLGVPDRMAFSETDLALMLSRQFPQQRRVLEVIDVELANPELGLQPEHNRLSTSFDVNANDRLFGGHAGARVRLDYGLRYEASDHTLRLQDVRVAELVVARDASPLRGHAQRLGALVAEHLLENLSIYRMKPELADRMDRLGVAPRAITVTTAGVEIAIGPRTGR